MRLFMIASILVHSFAFQRTAALITKRLDDNGIEYWVPATWLHAAYQFYLIHEFLVNDTPTKRDTLIYAAWHAIVDSVVTIIYVFAYTFKFEEWFRVINYSITMLIFLVILNVSKLILVRNFRAKEDGKKSMIT